MRWARRAVSVKTLQLAFALDDLGIGGEDFRQLAMQADADIRRKLREFLHQALPIAHNELEMRDVIALVRPDHQELVLLRRSAMQPIAAVKHEDFERGYAVIGDQMFH